MAKKRKPPPEPVKHVSVPLSAWRKLNLIKARTGKTFLRILAELIEKAAKED